MRAERVVKWRCTECGTELPPLCFNEADNTWEVRCPWCGKMWYAEASFLRPEDRPENAEMEKRLFWERLTWPFRYDIDDFDLTGGAG